jgi:hypothetical protein
VNVPVLKLDELSNLDVWLRSILWDSKLPFPNSENGADDDGIVNFEIHRLKARLPLSSGDIKIVQGVREVFEILDAPKPADSAISLEGKIVLIGRNLQGVRFEESLVNTIIS